MKNSVVFLIVSIVIAAGLWTLMFCPATAPYVNFWGTMCVSAVVLVTLTLFAEVKWWQDLGLCWKTFWTGLGLAGLLWGIFWIGDKVSSLLLDFARPQVEMIYGIRSDINPVLLSLLLVLFIGPAEEIFWRGYIQRALSDRIGKNLGFAVAVLAYAGVHVPSCNFMLVMAALTAGIVWGLFYRFFPDKLGVLVVSHALWDAAVFVWFPI